MANPQRTTRAAVSPPGDHRILMDTASRCYSDAVRRGNETMMARANDLAIKAYELAPNYLPGINLLARIELQRQHLDRAEHWAHLGLSLKPKSTSLLYSAGHIALARGELDQAEEFFSRACRISRVNTKSATFLAHVKLLQGDYLEAFQQYRELAKTQANDPQIRNKLFEAANNIVADFYSAELEQDLLRYLEFPDVDYSNLRPLATSLIKHKLRLSEAGCPLELDEIAQDPLLLTCLTKFYFSDPLIERLLMTLRQTLLISCSRQLAIRNEYLPLVCALAYQCFLNESVWYINHTEASLVKQLTVVSEKMVALNTLGVDDCYPILLLIFMYKPAANTSIFETLAEREWQWPTLMQPLINASIKDTFAMHQQGLTIPNLGVSSNSVSTRVQAQYDEHPYPRWTALGYNQPANYYASLKALFPYKLNDLPNIHKTLNVLVAGCGTGRHALRLSRYFEKLNVTAMDLSRTALSYGRYQAQLRNLKDIDFIQGDILVSERLGQSFDIIECSGVLHHMEKPEAGLQALARQLKAGGLMKIALYSRTARLNIAALRSQLKDQLPHGNEEIRLVREALLQGNVDGDWNNILQSDDFYSLSACRDLLFHEQEHVFNLTEIDELVKNAGLEWVGILPPHNSRALSQQHLSKTPDTMTIEDWDELEQKEPAIFAGMYQFYVRKPQNCH